MVQFLYHGSLETCRQRADFGERHAQTRCLNRLNGVVIVVVRLESVQQRIALTLQCLIRLIDREIVFGDERAVMPRLTDVISELFRFVPGKEPNNDKGGHKDKPYANAQTSPYVLLRTYYLFKRVHFTIL